MDRVTVAGVDCGTNSIRLLVAQVDETGLHPLAPRTTQVIRLGEGVDQRHRFSDQALDRAYKACRVFAKQLRQYRLDGLRFVATSATRDASNQADFEEGVRSILGVRPEVITGTEEAGLSFLGAISVMQASKRDQMPSCPYMVVDLGGGSTELVLGGDGRESPADQAEAAYSMNMGSVRITERYLAGDPPSQEEIDQALKDVDKNIDQALMKLPIEHARTLVGVSGTITTMSALALGCKQYDPRRVDGVTIPVNRVYAADSRVLHMSREERRRVPTIHPGRIDVIGGGALIWSRLLDRVGQICPNLFENGGYIASEHGLLDGLVLDYGRRLLRA